MNNLIDAAAERSILGGLCAFGESYFVDIAHLVNVESFGIHDNQILYACIEKVLSSQPTVDLPSILSAAGELGLTQVVMQSGFSKHIRSVLSLAGGHVLKVQNARKSAVKVRKLQSARELRAIVEGTLQTLDDVSGDEPLSEIVSYVENPIFEFVTKINSIDDKRPTKLGEGAVDYFQELIDNPRESVGIASGFPLYDKAKGGGFRKGCLDIIAAFSKAGKTFLGQRMGINVALLDIPVFFADSEMSKEEHLIRAGAMFSGLPIEHVEIGKISKADREKLLKAAEAIEKLPYTYHSMIGEPFEETVAHIRRWLMRDVGFDSDGKCNPCLIVYDYIKMMSADQLLSSGMSEYQAIGFIANGLKNLSGHYGASVLSFVQLNREGGVSQSDRLKWFCTSLYKYEWKSEAENAECPGYSHKLYEEVTRHGEGLDDNDYINIRTDYRTAGITEGPLRSKFIKAKAKRELDIQF